MNDWQEHKDELKAKKHQREKDYTALILLYEADLDYDFEVKMIAEYHLRLTSANKKSLDYFPQSTKATWVGSNKWFRIPDIEKFIQDNFKVKK